MDDFRWARAAIFGGLWLAAGCSVSTPTPPIAAFDPAQQLRGVRDAKTRQLIFATAAAQNSLTEYNFSGKVVRTITTALDNPQQVAVDAKGKIYVANYSANTVTTYTKSGQQTTPTITAGLNEPVGVAVDAKGKIYVTNQGNNTLTTYTADGKQTTPTITKGMNDPGYLTVDSGGKIYVPQLASNSVTTYTSSGKPTKPTLTGGLVEPVGVAVQTTGKIWVTSYTYGGTGAVMTFTPAGKRTTPTITYRLSGPAGLALTSNKVSVANSSGDSISTYTLKGALSKPIITNIDVTDVAVHAVP
jgi:NHL repeat